MKTLRYNGPISLYDENSPTISDATEKEVFAVKLAQALNEINGDEIRPYYINLGNKIIFGFEILRTGAYLIRRVEFGISNSTENSTGIEFASEGKALKDAWNKLKKIYNAKLLQCKNAAEVFEWSETLIKSW